MMEKNIPIKQEWVRTKSDNKIKEMSFCYFYPHDAFVNQHLILHIRCNVISAN